MVEPPVRDPSAPRRAHRRPQGALSLGLALVLLAAAAGCSGDRGAELAGGRGTTTVPKFFPLTGLQATDAAALANLARPAAVVKIENSPQSRPQGGLDSADVVFEAVVEGGQSRFLAVFHSTDAPAIGPVRSVRPSDPAMVAPFGGMVAYSGGIGRFVEAMRATGLKNFDENATDVLRRRSDRRAPHNLYTSTEALYTRAGGGSPPPRLNEFLPPGQPFAPAGGVPVTRIDLALGRTTAVAYDWDAASGTWMRSTDGRPHLAESGAQIAPTTVIVQFTPYGDTGEVDPSGSPVSEAKVVGSGEAVVFANGTMLRGRWSKPNATAMISWTDAAGAPLSLPPGRTWVEMPATGAALGTR